MLSYALISTSKVSRVRAGTARAVATACLAGCWGRLAVCLGAAAVSASVVRSSRSRSFIVDRDGSASFRGRRSGTLRARKLRVVHTTVPSTSNSRPAAQAASIPTFDIFNVKWVLSR